MLKTTYQLFSDQKQVLAPYALHEKFSRGRQYPDLEDEFRTPFQKDRDRIIHSKAFRRLKGKTQVFIAGYHDHVRSRMEHSLELAQIARDMCRNLGLNEDLAEAISLAHNLGHPPFGHAGGEALDQLMMKYDDNFRYQDHNIRVIELLEVHSDNYPGLNLSWEVREGLKKHLRFHDEDHKQSVVMSLEAQVVILADVIACLHHDVDDGLRSGVLKYEELEASSELIRWCKQDLSRITLSEEHYRRLLINRMINILIEDALHQTHFIINSRGITHALETPNPKIVSFSEKIQGLCDELSEFLGKYFYLDERVYTQSALGQNMIKTLFQLYIKKPNILPLSKRKLMDKMPIHVVVKDHIAGMTDAYLTKHYQEYRDLIVN